MAKKAQSRTVFKKDDKWHNKDDSASRSSSTHDTQKQAYDAARDMIKKAGGGEVKVKGENGTIREKNTIPPAKDPYPPKG